MYNISPGITPDIVTTLPTIYLIIPPPAPDNILPQATISRKQNTATGKHRVLDLKHGKLLRVFFMPKNIAQKFKKYYLLLR